MSLYWRPFIACLLVLISLALLSALPLGAIGQSKTVLAIYSDERLLPANIAVDTALRDSLGLETDNPRTYLSEFLDVSRFGSSDYDKLLSDFFHSKYTGQHLDVIVASGPLAFQFLRRHQADLFTGIPVVLCGVGRESFESQTLPPNFVGVPIAVESLPTIELALRLQPDAREIVIVTGTSEFYRSLEDTLRRDLPHLQTSIPIRYLSGLPLDDLLRELSPLSPNSIVYSPGLLRDSAGRTYIPHDVLRRMADASTAPIYGSYSTYVGSGIVGGYMFTMEDLGRQAAGLVRKVLDGEKLSQADTSVAPPSRYMFDWKQLQRWHIPEKNLPPGSIVLYRELSGWQRYQPYIIGSLSLILLQTLLILALLWQRAAKRKVKADLILAHVRLHSAMVSGKAVGWEWDLKSERDSWFGDLKTMFGIPSEARVGRPEDLYRYVHPEDRQRVSEAVAEARRSHQPYRAQFRVVWPDGTLRWVSAEGKFYYSPEGEPERMLGMAVDITERKQGEEALKKSEEKFSKAFRESPLAVTVTSAKDHRYIDVNETFERITGWRRDEVIGRTPLDLGICAEPDDRMELLEEIQTKGTVRNVEFRFRYKDGEERVGLRSAEGIEIENEPCILTVTADITERKRAQDAMQRQAQLIGQVHDALVTTDLKGSVTFWNEGATRVFGYSAEEALGKPLSFLYPENQHSVLAQEIVAPVQEKGWHETETRVRSKSGREFPVHLSLALLKSAEGDTVGMIASAIDLTERERAENAVRESEQRFRLVANTAPVMLWMSGLDKLCNYFNQPWLEFTGRPLEAELGNGWAELVHREDLSSCLDTYTQAFDRRESFKMQYRLRRHDGNYRWLSDIGVPRFNPDGSFAGYIGSCLDVTDSKLAEESLASMGRRLIEAHEEERTWIARELHDDVNQRIALVAIELERWSQHLPESAADLHDHIHHARQRLSDVSKDIQALSHRLHSSKLEYLGLVAAANSFCKEFSEQQKVRIEFSHLDVPRTLPREISLCLFRVLQEAVQNAAKHSGARHFNVDLRRTAEGICLTVRDQGVGFDWQSAENARGLGLISMKERLQLVSGELSLKSEPGSGTAISARVPFRPEKHLHSAAG